MVWGSEFRAGPGGHRLIQTEHALLMYVDDLIMWQRGRPPPPHSDDSLPDTKPYVGFRV